MAKLFIKEYHELSNTWYFKSKVLPFYEGELQYQAVKNEQDQLLIRFFAMPEKKKYLPEDLLIIYNSHDQKIIDHFCKNCPEDKSCNHYLTVLDYAYRYLTTPSERDDNQELNTRSSLIIDSSIKLYTNSFLAYNAYWQLVILNGKILLEGIFDRENDKMRFYFSGYKDIDFRLIATFNINKAIPEKMIKRKKRTNNIPNLIETIDWKLIEEQTNAFRDSELSLINLLNSIKCSYSNKQSYFTIYKKDLIRTFPYLKDLQDKVLIKETGEHLIFTDNEYPLSLKVNKEGDTLYKISATTNRFFSMVFTGNENYIFVGNIVHQLQLPFQREITEQILQGGYQFPEKDLVYFASIVTKQTGLNKCYIDFASDIELPPINSSNPRVVIKLFQRDDKVILTGQLNFENERILPLKSLFYESELVSYKDPEGIEEWYYIPYDKRMEILDFVQMLPFPEQDIMALKSELIYSSEEQKDRLKKVLYEKIPNDWTLLLDDALKNEFIFRVDLRPTISISETGKIDWFEYQVTYKYGEITFTHEELSRFFRSRDKYLKLQDNSLIYFTGKENFTQIDDFLTNARKQSKSSYYLSNYNLTYLYSLAQVNENIQLIGEPYLEQLYSDLLRRHTVETDDVPRSLFNVMRSYQKTGFYWLKMLQSYRLGGLLADDMGLGKTLQSLAILSDYYEQSHRERKVSLVVCPKTLLFNWAMEIEKFHPNLTYTIYEGSKSERLSFIDNNTSDIIIVSYSLIQMDIEKFSKQNYAYVILDEAQHIKNPLTLRSKAVKKLQAEHRLALTGTPMENNLIDIWSIFDFLMPGYLLSLSSFRKEYSDDKNDREEKHKQLTKIISPFVLRRKKSEVLLELPDKQEQYLYNKMTLQQERVYLKILAMAKEKLTLSTGKEIRADYINILTALIRLRQICNHPGLIDKELYKKANMSGKMELLMELIQDAVENNRKILVFSQFAMMLKLIAETLAAKGMIYEYMDGKTDNRQERVEHFTSNENVRIFLLTLKVGGLGLNLTAADTVIIVDPWWNPMSENQSIDRVYRIGQTKKVMVYKIITKGTVEEKILQLQEQKRHIFSSVIEASQSLIKKMTYAEVRSLFEYNR